MLSFPSSGVGKVWAGVSPVSTPLPTKNVIERVETGTICVLRNFIQSGFGLNFPPYHGNAYAFRKTKLGFRDPTSPS